MARTKEHYENYLAEHYSWMLGDTKSKQLALKEFFLKHGIFAKYESTAIDLGAGNGLQSIVLAELGYQVKAIDFCVALLNDLRQKATHLPIEIISDDMMNVANYATIPVDLVVCAGDTLTHLPSLEAVKQLIESISKILKRNGNIYFSFRDYTTPLSGNQRIIPVQSDEHKIMTCFLEYSNITIDVTDMIQFYKDGKWQTHFSTYTKIRISSIDVIYFLEKAGMTITNFTKTNNTINILAKIKP